MGALAVLCAAAAGAENPFEAQVVDCLARLQSDDATVRAGAVEALGYLRAYTAGDALADLLEDTDAVVRREAATALAWCGGRPHIDALLAALEDPHWTVRQAA